MNIGSGCQSWYFMCDGFASKIQTLFFIILLNLVMFFNITRSSVPANIMFRVKTRVSVTFQSLDAQVLLSAFNYVHEDF